MTNKLEANKDNLKHDNIICLKNNTYEINKLSNTNIVEDEFDELDKYLTERENTLSSNDAINKTYFNQFGLNNPKILNKSIDIQSKVIVA